jgi:hypothetical protein
MANSVTTQVIQDGPRNYVLKVNMLLDTADVTITDLITPSGLSSLGDINGACSRVSIQRIEYDVEDTLTVNLYWDATADVPIVRLVGRGTFEDERLSGMPNNAGAGITGKVQYDTQGWSASAILAATFTIYAIKS